MSNGFVKHKVVQWVFNNTREMFNFVPKTEGVFALDNARGDIYIWNSETWILYYQGAIQVPNNRRRIPDNNRRADGGNPTSATGSNTFYCDANLFAGILYELPSVLNLIINTTNLYTGSISLSILTSSVSSPTGSGFAYTVVSHSIV